MAVRKVYLSMAEFPYAKEVPVTFPWSNGSKHQNIQAVLDTFHDVYPEVPVLEVSLASAQPEGVGAAAMKLPLRLADGQELPVGVVYQGSRVFENGGPYTDLWQLSRQKVQKDPRLHQSGRCIGYRLEGTDYPAEPHPYAFFNWLYCRAVAQNPDRGQELLRYGAFSDLDLGSAKTDRNSPARAAAVYGGLKAAGRLDCLASYEAFVAVTCEGAGPVSLELPPEPEAAAPQSEPPETPEPPKQEDAPAQEPSVPETAAPEAAPEDRVPPAPEQIEEICRAPKAKNLMISLAKNAACPANSAAGAVRAGRGLVLTSYRKALEENTLVINPEKNKIVFPLENPDNGFSTTGQLTRCPTFVQGWKLSYQPYELPPEPAAPAEQKPPVYPTAEEYLVSRGYTITQQVQPRDLPPLAVQKLAWDTGRALADPVAAAFLQFIRSHLQFHDSFTFRMPKDASQDSRELVVELAQSWDHLGLFAVCSASPLRIICKLASENEAVRNFASGHWLELYVVHCVQQLLDRYQTQQNAAVSLCSNVILSDSPEVSSAHELDVAFSVNGAFFWIEAKSSSRNIDYGKYADLCNKLQVSPDRLLLVNSDLTEEDCRGVAYFWPYRVANCATMTEKLEEMIRSALQNDGAAES